MPPAATETSLTASAVLRDYAMTELDRAIECLGWRGLRVHAGVHQARKSMRRVRATLALGGIALGPGSAILDRELQGIIRSLSSVRDAQAVVEALDRLAEKSASDGDVRLLRRACLAAARARAGTLRAARIDDPGFRNKRVLLEFMRTMLSALPWACASLDQVNAAIACSSLAVVKAARRARDSGRDDDLHRWRRRARRYSQQQRVLAGMGAQTAVGSTGKALAVLLGEAQDYALLREHCRNNVMFRKRDRLALRKLVDKSARRVRRKIAAASVELA